MGGANGEVGRGRPRDVAAVTWALLLELWSRARGAGELRVTRRVQCPRQSGAGFGTCAACWSEPPVIGYAVAAMLYPDGVAPAPTESVLAHPRESCARRSALVASLRERLPRVSAAHFQQFSLGLVLRGREIYAGHSCCSRHKRHRW